jgi:hypothetical protein
VFPSDDSVIRHSASLHWLPRATVRQLHRYHQSAPTSQRPSRPAPFRSHEALGQKRPATIYRPSPRPYPETLPPIEYAGHLEKRKIEHNGMMCWKNGRIFTSKTLRGEYVGLEEIDDGIWSVYYGPVLLARFDEREMRFYG